VGRVPRYRLDIQGIVRAKEDKPSTALTSASGIRPNSKDVPGYYTDYSIPAIQYTDGTREQDSWPIAHELEKRYPSPSLHLEDPIVLKVRDQIARMFDPLRVHFIPKVVRILPQRSAEYFEETREKRFGMPLSEVLKNAGEDSWEKAEVFAKETGDLLRKHEGPFFLGETVSYADFIFVSLLRMMERVDEPNFERFLALDSTFPKVYEASKQWLEKDR
jgi:glutathione S-transferase